MPIPARGMANEPVRSAAARERRAFALFLVLLTAFLLYVPSVANGFAWDDPWAALAQHDGSRHPFVAELRPPWQYFSCCWWPHRSAHCETFRPLTTFWFALRHAVAGDSAVAAHLANVLLHVACVGASIALLRRLGASFAAALCGGLAFALHGLHSEAVLSIVGGAELLAFGLGAAATLCLLRAVRRGGTAAFVGGAVLLAFALFAKESAVAWVVFAPLCVVAAAWQRGEALPDRRRALALAAAVLLPLAVFVALYARALAALPPGPDPGLGHTENPLRELPFATRLPSALLSWSYGLLLTVLPLRLAVDYGPAMLPVVASWREPLSWLAALVGVLLVAAAVAAVVQLRRRPLPALAVACALGFSFAISNVPLPVFMHFAERTWFTPTFAVALAVAWAADRARTEPRALPWLAAAFGLWLGAVGQVAFARNAVWRSDEALVAHELLHAPDNLRLRLIAGAAARRARRIAEARDHFAAAAAIDPACPDPWLELALCDLADGDPIAAAAMVERAQRGRAADVATRREVLDALAARARAAAPK